MRIRRVRMRASIEARLRKWKVGGDFDNDVEGMMALNLTEEEIQGIRAVIREKWKAHFKKEDKAAAEFSAFEAGLMKPWADEERPKGRLEAELTWSNFEVESGLAKIRWMARILTWPRDFKLWTTPPNF